MKTSLFCPIFLSGDSVFFSFVHVFQPKFSSEILFEMIFFCGSEPFLAVFSYIIILILHLYLK